MRTLDRWKRGIRNTMTNWQQPLPVTTKLYLFLRNNTIKVVKRQECCGNHGEPGC